MRTYRAAPCCNNERGARMRINASQLVCGLVLTSAQEVL